MIQFLREETTWEIGEPFCELFSPILRKLLIVPKIPTALCSAIERNAE